MICKPAGFLPVGSGAKTVCGADPPRTVFCSGPVPPGKAAYIRRNYYNFINKVGLPLPQGRFYGIMVGIETEQGSSRPDSGRQRYMQLILASNSPRRRDILADLGIPFTVRTADADETCSLENPAERVAAIAVRKCRAVCNAMTNDGTLTDDTLVVAADTLVYCEGAFLGKPHDSADAAAMLRLLSGRTHSVWSGIAAVWNGHTVTAAEETAVTFSVMAERDIAAYLASGEPFGKAGAYAIQGGAARYITGIRGDYFNVVGLPVHRLVRTLKQSFGILL